MLFSEHFPIHFGTELCATRISLAETSHLHMGDAKHLNQLCVVHWLVHFSFRKKSSLLRNHSYLKIYKSCVWNHKKVGCTPTDTSRRNSKPSYVLYFIGSFCCRYTHTYEGYSTTMFYGLSACLASVIAYYFINRWCSNKVPPCLHHRTKTKLDRCPLYINGLSFKCNCFTRLLPIQLHF